MVNHYHYQYHYPLSNLTYIIYLARSSVLAVMEKAIIRGHLTVADSEGVHHFGTRSKGCNDVYLKVVNTDFWMRILLYVTLSSLV
jgi:cyclopropane-fatty-acyl-phospholipid synthase